MSTTPVRDTLRRYRVVRKLSAVFDLTLSPLALATMALLIMELLVRVAEPWATTIYAAQIAIWVIFLLAFVVELSLAPKRLLYLKRNWLLVIALAVPALRVLRAAQALRFLQATRVVRGALLVRGITTLNRSMVAIRGFFGFSQMAFLLTLTMLVWLASSGLVYYLEDRADSPIDTPGNAFWWAATTITTVAASEEPRSDEGRVVAIALRVFGVAIFGYFTARLAAYFIGTSHSKSDTLEWDEVAALRREMSDLRSDLQSWRRDRDSDG